MIAMRHVPQALHVVAVLGIADLLADAPKSSDELALATGSHAHTLYRVLRTLVAAGVLAKDKIGRFCLTALGQPLRSNVADSVRAAPNGGVSLRRGQNVAMQIGCMEN
jgi:DNA-binding IclR family transcriptional regulator